MQVHGHAQLGGLRPERVAGGVVEVADGVVGGRADLAVAVDERLQAVRRISAAVYFFFEMGIGITDAEGAELGDGALELGRGGGRVLQGHGGEEAEAVGVGLHVGGVHFVVGSLGEGRGVGGVEDAFDARAGEGNDHVADAAVVHGVEAGGDVCEALDDVGADGAAKGNAVVAGELVGDGVCLVGVPEGRSDGFFEGDLPLKARYLDGTVSVTIEGRHAKGSHVGGSCTSAVS